MTPSISPQRRHRAIACVVVALVAAAPAAANAGKAEDARAHVAKATRAHKDGRYDEARVDLEAAYALTPRPELLYALGQVHAKLGRCREATAYFRRFAATQGDPRVGKVVDQAIAACKPAPVAEPPVVQPPAATDEPRVAGAPSPEPPPAADTPQLPALPRISSTSPPSAAAPRRPPFAASRAAPLAAPPALAPPRAPWYHDRLGDGLVLGGAVAAGVGLFEYASARSDLDAAEDRTATTTVARYHELLDSAHGKRTASIVLLGAGGALIASGVIRFALHTGDAEPGGLAIAPARGGAVVSFAGSL